MLLSLAAVPLAMTLRKVKLGRSGAGSALRDALAAHSCWLMYLGLAHKGCKLLLTGAPNLADPKLRKTAPIACQIEAWPVLLF